jgi:hypothetical protein
LGVIGARREEMIAVEVRHVVVIVLNALSKLPSTEAVPTSCADPLLGLHDGGSQDVIADMTELVRSRRPGEVLEAWMAPHRE